MPFPFFCPHVVLLNGGLTRGELQRVSGSVRKQGPAVQANPRTELMIKLTVLLLENISQKQRTQAHVSLCHHVVCSSNVNNDKLCAQN